MPTVEHTDAASAKRWTLLRILKWALIGAVAFGFAIFALVYTKTLPATNVAEQFYGHLSSGDTAAAFELTSARFRKVHSAEAFNRIVRDNQLEKFKSVFWYERHINGTGDAAIVRLAGSLSRQDGTKAPVAMRFVWIGNWVIDEIAGAGFGAGRGAAAR